MSFVNLRNRSTHCVWPKDEFSNVDTSEDIDGDDSSDRRRRMEDRRRRMEDRRRRMEDRRRRMEDRRGRMEDRRGRQQL